jgi:hypothetical protein
MNIAFSSILILSTLIPGIIFRKTYYSEEFSKQYFKASFFGVLSSTLIPTIIFQIIFILIFSFKIDFEIILKILRGTIDESVIENIASYHWNILSYFLLLSIVSAFLGYLSKKIIRYTKFDRKIKIFRFQNSWHYILKGEIFDFPKANINLFNDEVEDIELIFIDALLEVNGQAIIYDGILVDYELSQNSSGLETISIKSAKRRCLTNDRIKNIDSSEYSTSNKDDYYPINGHLLVLKYSDLKNLNFTYYKLDNLSDTLYSHKKVS